MYDTASMLKICKSWWPHIALLAIWFLVINVVSVLRFEQFEVYYFDHGIFDQALWKMAHFQTPYVDHLQLAPLNQLGDHFGPAMFILVPLYWVTSGYLSIIFLQNIFVILSGVLLFLIAREKVKSKLLVFAILFAYAFFVGMQNALIANFHTELPALFTLAVVLWAIEKKKWRTYWIFLILTLGLKETFFGLGIALAFFLWFRREKKIAVYTFIYSVIYFIFVTKLVIPYVSHGKYGYDSPMFKRNVFENTVRYFYPFIKLKTLFVGFATFGFLSLLAFSFLPVILMDYFARFVYADTPSRIDLGLHYNAIVTLLLANGAVLGVSRFRTFFERRYVSAFWAIAIILATLYFHQTLHGPLGLFYNSVFYTQTKNVNFLRSFIARIPNRGLVMTQNNFAVRLTHSHNVMLLRGNYWLWMPDVIAFDVREGQNPNNYWPLDPAAFRGMQEFIKSDPNYKQIDSSREQLIYVKNDSLNKKFYEK
jgi:uncharacterized membrane protein